MHSCLLHLTAAYSAYDDTLIQFFNCPDQSGAMDITGCLSGDNQDMFFICTSVTICPRMEFSAALLMMSMINNAVLRALRSSFP